MLNFINTALLDFRLAPLIDVGCELSPILITLLDSRIYSVYVDSDNHTQLTRAFNIFP